MLEAYLREALECNRKIVIAVVKDLTNRFNVHYDARRAVFEAERANGWKIRRLGQRVASIEAPPEQFVSCFSQELASTYFFGCSRKMEVNVTFDKYGFRACDTMLYIPCDSLEPDIVSSQTYDFKDALTRFQVEPDLVGLRASVQDMSCLLRASEKLASTFRVIEVSIDTANKANEDWEEAFKRSINNGAVFCKAGVKPKIYRIYSVMPRDLQLIVKLAKTISNEGSSICVQEIEEHVLRLAQREVRGVGRTMELVAIKQYNYFSVFDDLYTGKYKFRLQSEPFVREQKT